MKINIPDSVTFINDHAFYNCPDANVEILSGSVLYGYDVFGETESYQMPPVGPRYDAFEPDKSIEEEKKQKTKKKIFFNKNILINFFFCISYIKLNELVT